MNSTIKPIILTRHALEKMLERTATREEVTKAILQSKWQPAEQGRWRCTKWFPFGQAHFGTYYSGKDVQPVFVEETDRVVVVTVYVYLNQREG